MPILTIRKERFWRLIGRTLSDEELTSLLHGLGVDVEELTHDHFKIEYNPNRPDYSSSVGLARAAKGLMEIETGPPAYRLLPPSTHLTVDESVREVRPFIVAAIVRGLEMDYETLEELIGMQEDLHWIIGRDRRKVSIGLHNLDVLRPPFKYIAVKGDECRFRPLGGTREMTLDEILSSHEKGLKYGHILEGKPRYPIILDSLGQVLSFPPIINSSLTELTPRTRNIFIDVTGLDLDLLLKTLNILTTTMHEMGGRIERVKVVYPDGVVVTPDYRTRKWRISAEYVNSLLGTDLPISRIARLLRRMRHGVRIDGRSIVVQPPPYRVDIMHVVDFVEDVAMGMGYGLLEPRQPRVLTYGKLHGSTELENTVREIMLGLGYVETMNFTLSNEKDEYERMMVEPHPHVKLLNPVSADYTILRTWILPSLMKVLANNRGSPYPQKIFEVGDVIEPDPDAPERAVRKMRLGCVSCHANSSYSEMKSTCEEILRNLMVEEWRIEPFDDLPFIEGRAASILVGSETVGSMGEIHPAVLENWGITLPVSGLEIDLEKLTVLSRQT